MNIFKRLNIFWNNIKKTFPLYRQYRYCLTYSNDLRQLRELAVSIEQIWLNTKYQNKYIFLHSLVNKFISNIQNKRLEYSKKITTAENWVAEANRIFEFIKDDPFNINDLSQAINLYHKANELFFDKNFMISEDNLREILANRKKFINLYQKGKEKASQGYYKEGLSLLNEAKNLFYPDKLARRISQFQDKIKFEEEYEENLLKTKELAREGNFLSAYNQLQLALDKFQRQDGNELREKLQIVIDAKTDYRQGLMAEKIDNFLLAKKQYLSALSKLPQLTDANYRLALIDIKQHNFTSALSYLENLEEEKASYLRGFIYLQKNDYHNAVKEWKLVNNSLVNNDKESLKTLIQRNKLQIIKHIEDLVSEEKYQEAKICSENLLKQYGYDPKIDHNLNKHIQPALQHQLWQSQDLIQIITQLEQEFKQNPNLTTLHNMVIALYYQAQLDENYIERWINCWMTVLLNINKSEVFQNLSWLNVKEINYDKMRDDLIKIVEGAIDKYKDNNLDKYYQFRDILRRENLALELIGNPPKTGIKIKQIFITPGFYLQHQTQLKSIQLKTDKLSTLFTDWGLAVAACLKNDTERAIKIKPSQQHSSGVEKLAYHLINYYEGCYYLQHHSWRKAKNPLEISQTEIKNNRDWVTNINNLCEKQRQKIEENKEHLEFAQFWYDLLKSNQSASYLAEFKAREISQQVADDKISFSQAINKLKDVQNIDKNNPLVIDLLSRLEYSIEAEEVSKLIQQNKFEEVVRKLKYSSNQELKYNVASMFIEAVIKGANKAYLTYEEKQGLRDIAYWAYQICPYESDFQEIYRALGII
ncbi:peptidase M, neutral zinc metallopeptidase, zinc-binding site [Cyanobacterium sp. Dongsha4]|uniref:tetratricopeptide repeat protein n=1 Tax=Cyanobacterium sp. DS4 TaxID=2878255 RepID=UPI002E8049ED|nr:peptidase M, neutral zinc metallopeptidase, zinc-binding site [Cyanobacterium sp. Dongsha4]WVK98924.1 peptidase M, neutral zinc metallopeptidase, zinc-binding site [Cyanobacterium sp. Dongsha4]